MNALVLVDLQNDFCPGGTLAVPEGDLVIPVANRLQTVFPLVVATQDWHPIDHESFAINHDGKAPGDVIDPDGLEQILWPVHCVENTPGAAFHPDFDRSRVAQVFKKGTDPTIDSYSGFFDNGHHKVTGLGDYLKGQRVTHIYLAGLATDYCVKYSALDALKLGFGVTVVRDACRGVNLRPGDAERALEELQSKGVQIVDALAATEQQT